MSPRKTPLAHAALEAHRAPLSLRERRALILCDGVRSSQDVATLLGADGPALLDHLHQAGYLQSGAAPPPAPPRPAAAPPATAMPAPPRPAAATAAPAPPAANERKRSLVAARVYLQDMLELQHGLDRARILRQRLMDAREEEQQLAALEDALEELPLFTSAGYSERVRARVLEALPEPARTRLQSRLLGTGASSPGTQPQPST